MLPQLSRSLQQACRLDPQRPFIMGVSGGSDSLALLDGLCRMGYRPLVAHLDHHLRPDSAADARHVGALAVERDLVYLQADRDVAAEAAAAGLSLEEAARIARYEFLFEQACRHSAQAVLVAHTADDQVETVLMHLLRGTGLDGLSGMRTHTLPNPWSNQIPLLRPLLSVWRSEIEAYLAEYCLTPLEDQTNLDTTIFRNRLRHRLLPDLDDYVPGVRKRLWQTADLLNADRELLETLTETAWLGALSSQEPAVVGLDLAELRCQPLGLRRRLLRKAAAQLRPGVRDIDFALVQRALDFIEQPPKTNHLDAGLGLELFLEDGLLYLAASAAALPRSAWPQTGAQQQLPVPGTLDCGAGWVLQAEFCANSAQLRAQIGQNQDLNQAWAGLDQPVEALQVRPRHAGERFQPLGMPSGSLKLSDFMINQKLPRRARAAWPLVCQATQVVWIPGLRLAEPYRVRQDSRVVIYLRLVRSPDFAGV